MERLSASFRCIAPDQLGFGKSDKPRGDHYRIPMQAERAAFLLDHFGCARAQVIGHSMGGQIALTLAAYFPHLVSRLVVVAPVVSGSLHPMVWPLLLYPMLARRGIEFPYHWTNTLGRQFPALGIQMMRSFFPHPKKRPAEALYWLGQMGADGQMNSSAWAQKATAEWDVRPLLKYITAPTLAIWGVKDWLVPEKHGVFLEKGIATCSAVRIPEVGHFPMIEAFGVYREAVEKFFAEAHSPRV